MPAGYSGTPLAKKLGIKSGFRIKVRNSPPDYHERLAPLPAEVVISASIRPPIDLWHLFARSRRELATHLPTCRKEIRHDGMIWVSWPKKSSGVASDLTEDTIRERAFPLQLVDVKVCAIDETWSGLKLVIRREHRTRTAKKRGVQRAPAPWTPVLR